MSQYSHVFVGGSSDPQPVFRDEVADGETWPTGAVMAIQFLPARFPTRAAELPLIEYFGEDGWPIEFAASRKDALPEQMKLEFQVFPWSWRSWKQHTWEKARLFPRAFKIGRMQARAVRALVPFTSALAKETP